MTGPVIWPGNNIALLMFGNLLSEARTLEGDLLTESIV